MSILAGLMERRKKSPRKRDRRPKRIISNSGMGRTDLPMWEMRGGRRACRGREAFECGEGRKLSCSTAFEQGSRVDKLNPREWEKKPGGRKKSRFGKMEKKKDLPDVYGSYITGDTDREEEGCP